MPEIREVERRYVTSQVDFRAASDGGPGQLYGYAARYNVYSQNLGGFIEEIDPGAFTKSLADGVRVMCRYNHSDNHLLGTTDAGTLTVTSDNMGLPYVVDLPDTSTGRDVGVLAARGDVRYSSFAFICIEDEWGVSPQGFPVRRLLQVQLVDVAPVNNPAYLDTSAAKRSLEGFCGSEVEDITRTEEVRSLILGAKQAPEPPTDEQRDTHSYMAAIESLRMELDELK